MDVKKNDTIHYVFIAVALAFVLWTLMFSPWTAPFIPFWPTMSVSAIVLSTWAFLFTERSKRREPGTGNRIPILREALINIGLGIVIAAVLWGIFWVGDKASQWMFPSFARVQVNGIYGMKTGVNPWLLSCLMLFIIGPAEELFWRGYVQKTMTARWGIYGAIGAILLYALIHLFSLNFMLIMAALVCGVVWGGLFYFFPRRFPAIIISHALWDAAVFIWFPI